MSGWGSFGYNQQESESSSRTGLRGTPYEGLAAQQAAGQGMLMSNFANEMFKSPESMFKFGQQMLPGGQYGLGSNADAAVEKFGGNMFSKASASGAMRGQQSPANMGGIIGSAITNSLPFLIPQIQQFQSQQFMAPQNLMQLAKTSSDYWSRALGGQSDASSFGFGINVAGGGGAASSGGG